MAMDIFDKAKQLFEGASRKVNELVGQRACMRICMMGPRAVGKTTTLTSIFHNTSESVSHTKLKFVPDTDTQAKMSMCRRELEQIFENRRTLEERPSAGISSTPQVSLFLYEFGLKGKPTSVDMEIKDFPGEYINGGLHTGEIDKFISESNAVVIAIDTPHMMESNGQFNEARNSCRAICDYFDSNLNDVDEKLILFVPLKCEKYYFEGRIAQVNSRVKEAYATLIEKIKSFPKIACVITPILTIGGVEFEYFQRDSSGHVLTDPSGVPEKALYKFRGHDAKFSPMYCVQPLYYILSFVTKTYDANKSKGNIVKKLFAGLFNLFSSDIDFYTAMKETNKNMLVNRNGFEVIQGKDLIV